MDKNCKIKITKNGPYIVTGGVPLREDATVPPKHAKHPLNYNKVKDYTLDNPEQYALCRCGASSHKPFCDGTHAKIDFDGTEVADKTAYLERAQVYEGPALTLYDDNRCAYARLCHRQDGDEWDLAEAATHGDPELEREALAGACLCPAGRLEVHNKETDEVYEQKTEPMIVVLEDPQLGVSGPLFVRGGIPLEGADGEEYELRQRYALCRCGQSENKPFCNAMHVNAKFTDGSAALEGDVGTPDASFEELPEPPR